uniref:Uncharacterized protein n=1 Tax=Anguilla anguilla TaxID=7936 RepID=A0A0E9RQX4_ANGAN
MRWDDSTVCNDALWPEKHICPGVLQIGVACSIGCPACCLQCAGGES